MGFLLAAILLNGYLAVVFKIFERYNIDNLQAIIFNYWTCVATGSVFLGSFPVNTDSISQPWAPWSVLMGVLFITLFNIVARSTAAVGITPTSVANKLSLMIPVAAAVLLYDDSLPLLKIAGILVALPAVYLSSRSGDDSKTKDKKAFLLPVIIFIGSGLLDTLVTWVTKKFLTSGNTENDLESQSLFLVHAFAVAAILGAVLLSYMLLSRRRSLAAKNVLAGVLLGVPNFFSIYYVLRLLHSGWLQSSAAIPVINIGVVLFAGLSAIVFFKEKTKPQRLIGLGLSVLSIALILLSELRKG